MPTGRTAAAAATASGKLQTARSTLKSLKETVLEKRQGCRILAEGNGIIGLDGLGWNHPLVLEYLDDLALWEQDVERQRREIAKLEALAAQEAAAMARFIEERSAAEAAWRAAGNTGAFRYYAERHELSSLLAERRARDVARNRRNRHTARQSRQTAEGNETMVTVRYQDKRGAGHVDYPRTEDDLIRVMKRLHKQHIEAVVMSDGIRVGVVQPDSAAPGGWTWWFVKGVLPVYA